KNIPGHETFGMVCCTLKKEEIEKNGLTVHNLALEPIRILVNKSNPINDLPEEKIRAIFRGDIKNWAEVGGQDKPIVVVTRLHCKGRPGHWKTILPSEDDFRKERLDVKSASEMAERINDFPGGIGHIGATWDYKDDDKVKYIKVSGYEPNAKNLANKKYPFYRQLSAVTAGTVTDDLKILLNEVRNGAGFKKASKRYGLLPN
ncbi:MAG: substrate-binding domain-containing protein, partial [Gammaproteobacteria bacterium]|nr:substrate-binding domain-containing protein [Gammaproteobacteria bacterium]